jgi:hypothetical protein
MAYIKLYEQFTSTLNESTDLTSEWKKLSKSEADSLESKVGTFEVKNIENPREYVSMLSTMSNKTYWMSLKIPKKRKVVIENLMNHYNIKPGDISGSDLNFINTRSTFSRFIEGEAVGWRIIIDKKGNWVRSKKLKKTSTKDPIANVYLKITDDDGPLRKKIYDEEGYFPMARWLPLENTLKNQTKSQSAAKKNKLIKDFKVDGYYARTFDKGFTVSDILNSKTDAIWLSAAHIEKFSTAFDKMLFNKETYNIDDDMFIGMIGSDDKENLELLLQQAQNISVSKDTLIKGLLQFSRTNGLNKMKVEKLYKLIDPDFYDFVFPYHTNNIRNFQEGLIISMKRVNFKVSDELLDYMVSIYKNWLYKIR